ncbi:MAG: alpha/beta family hydrolase [Planctomycetota bacterium]
MSSRPLLLSVPHEGVQHVSMLLDEPPEGAPDVETVAFLFAHGAGAPMTSTFIEGLATRLAAGGLPVLRFQYAYMEQMQRSGKRRPPDRRSVLELVHRAAHSDARQRFKARRLLMGGKSLGGRMASYLAAEGDECAGLMFFGYPLHPPGKPEKQRSEHFPALAQPALFLQGDRDALCDLELLRPALETYGGRATLEVIPSADHGFDVLRSAGLSTEAVLDALAAKALAWVRATFPA